MSGYISLLSCFIQIPLVSSNSVDPDQTSRSAASDLGLHCLPGSLLHYENMPIQIYRKFDHQKKENFQIKNSDIFLISAQNIDFGYSLEPPRRGGSNEYPQSMF